METNTTPVISLLNQEIQISGLRLFPEREWCEAIHYLEGVWSNNNDVMYRPKSILMALPCGWKQVPTLIYVYGGIMMPEGISERIRKGNTLEIACNQSTVELGLVRFVKDNSISQLLIRFPKSAWFSLQKTVNRGEYVVDGAIDTDQPLSELRHAFDFYYADMVICLPWFKELYFRF